MTKTTKTTQTVAPEASEPVAAPAVAPEASEPQASADAASTDLATTPDAGDVLYADADEDLDSEDSLTFSNGVIEKIVAISVRDVPGVLGMKGGFINRVQETFGQPDPTKGVSVEVMPDNSVRVNISVLIEYGAYAPQVFEDVKKVVVKQVGGMTGLEVGGVNLRIEDVLTPEEYERMKRGHSSEDEATEGEAE